MDFRTIKTLTFIIKPLQMSILMHIIYQNLSLQRRAKQTTLLELDR